jgi:hypothetical protein
MRLHVPVASISEKALFIEMATKWLRMDTRCEIVRAAAFSAIRPALPLVLDLSRIGLLAPLLTVEDLCVTSSSRLVLHGR